MAVPASWQLASPLVKSTGVRPAADDVGPFTFSKLKFHSTLKFQVPIQLQIPLLLAHRGLPRMVRVGACAIRCKHAALTGSSERPNKPAPAAALQLPLLSGYQEPTSNGTRCSTGGASWAKGAWLALRLRGWPGPIQPGCRSICSKQAPPGRGPLRQATGTGRNQPGAAARLQRPLSCSGFLRIHTSSRVCRPKAAQSGASELNGRSAAQSARPNPAHLGRLPPPHSLGFRPVGQKKLVA